LFSAGDQLPVIGVALVDNVGSGDSDAPEQMGATALNVGVMFGLIVKVAGKVATGAQPAFENTALNWQPFCPEVGVNVKTLVKTPLPSVPFPV
jgi:hypothetical protein